MNSWKVQFPGDRIDPLQADLQNGAKGLVSARLSMTEFCYSDNISSRGRDCGVGRWPPEARRQLYYPTQGKMIRVQREKALQTWPEIATILVAVAECFSVSVAELKQSTRTRAVVLPRQIAMYLAKQITCATLGEIGLEFGGKHHSTVMHSIARIHRQRSVDKDLNRAITTLLEKLRRPRA